MSLHFSTLSTCIKVALKQLVEAIQLRMLLTLMFLLFNNIVINAINSNS